MHKLNIQRPYTSVAPLQKAEVDIFTGASVADNEQTRKKCILIAGPCHTGKTTLGQYLASEFNYVHVEMSSFAWQRFLNRPEDFKGNLLDYMENEVWKVNTYDAIAQDLLKAHGSLNRLVICGPRRPEEVETILCQGWDVYTVYLYSNAHLRFQRLQAVESESRYSLAYSDFVKRDLREYAWGLAKVGLMKGIEILLNEGRIDDLKKIGQDLPRI